MSWIWRAGLCWTNCQRGWEAWGSWGLSYRGTEYLPLAK